MEDLFSFKELEPCYLKATYPIEIGNRTIESGEVLAQFDKIQVAGLQNLIERKSANGGFDNRGHVFWESTKEIDLRFSQGVFSKLQFALLSNSKLVKIGEKEKVPVTKTESKESNENGIFELEQVPNKLFLYNKETGDKITEFTQNEKEIIIAAPFLEVLAQYTYDYAGGGEVVKIGSNLFSGYIELEGRTRVKDDTTGHVVTGLIRIPRLKLMSDLSIRLGAQANPVVANFNAVGVPVGSRGNSYVSEFFFLNNDVDSDF